MKRVLCLVADGFGVGAAPDAISYGDEGSNTFGHIAASVGGLRLPNLQKLGLGCLTEAPGIPCSATPAALVGRMAERSVGKDTTTGHWELAGLVTRKPFALFPQGFSDALVRDLVREAGIPGVLGNKAASGTGIIEELGEEHLRSGKPILYTSADSVLQIAAHEERFGLERLFAVCEVARRLTIPLQIARVIARPFTGTDRSFKRTEHRRDYSLDPATNCLDVLKQNGVNVCSVGKIDDIFNHRGMCQKNHTGNNADGLKASLDFLKKNRNERAFIFANLVDFDMLFGHRRDPAGYANALTQLDDYLPKLLSELTSEDCLLLTSDHGCDPTFRGTDHTREYVPMICYRPDHAGKVLADRDTFADVAASILDAYGISKASLPDVGKSFL